MSDAYELVTYPFGPGTRVVARGSREEDQSSTQAVLSQWPGLYFKPDFKPREQFSASQIETSLGCEMAWGFRYLWGLKPREFSWLEVLQGSGEKRDKSTAFGKAMHAQGEAYYTTGHYDSDSAPGRALTAGLHLLPHPTQCEEIEVELGVDLDTNYILAGVEPVKFVGFKDLVAKVSGEWYLFDYKSTRDFDYQKQLDDRRSKRGFIIHGLRDDLASNVYALDVMQKIGQDSLRGRWVYFKSEGRPEAKPTDLVWDRSYSKEIVKGGLIKALDLRRHIRAGTSPHELDANPENCTAYGGCPYRASAGGPCTKENSNRLLLGSALEALSLPTTESETNQMPQLPNESLVQMKIREARANAAAAQGAAPQAQAPQPGQGFAPPPAGGFIQPTLTQPPIQTALPPQLQPQQFAPPQAQYAAPQPPPPVQQFAPPQAQALPPVQSHVLPPEAAQAPPAPELPPQLPPPMLQAPGGPVAGPLGEPPTKRRGRPAKAKGVTNDPGSAVTQGFAMTCTCAIAFGGATITIEADSAEDAQGLAEIVQAALS